MTSTVDPRLAAQQIVAGLTGPGGPFELGREEVLGSPVAVFTSRARALHELLAESVQHGDRTYIATADRRITFAEHGRLVASLAEELRSTYGIKPGDRVAIAAANSPEWIAAFWATVSIGAISVGFNAWWSPRELAYGLEHAQPALVVADAKRAAALRDSGVRVLTVEDDLPRLGSLHPDAPLPQADVAEDDPAVILYTSGTSGRPKGATHSHRNLCSVVEYHRLNDAILAAFGDPTDPRDRSYLLALPLFHIASLHNLAVPRLATGSKIALHEGAFDVDRVMRLVEAERVTNWGAVPTMASRLLEHDLSAYDTSSLSAFALASAPSSVQFKERLRSGLPFASSLVDSYGLTESCTAVAVATPMDLAESPGTLGRPIIGVELEVRDADDRLAPVGVEGEICVRSAFNMLGYWGDEKATRAAFRGDRWLHTGDIGTRDEQGRISLSSRRSDLIIRGGENVYPAEIEAVLTEHPDVVECLVMGIDHPDLGQEVAVVVVPAEGAAGAAGLEDELASYAAAELAYYKVPTHWRFSSQPLPRNATGKVVRAAVKP
ncbi:class I adenylate-forming enzyme family protein [Nocardioides piscis]|uniref:Acyl--CoA ligase n=1 Tax=Nocardioides piscis TaxID=2714938 RepID=A0A6G7YHB0_9ACTN|nr:class I adenylate-forming enzyme family protein [Nocardioides piscis]QIK76160.1 acyl--CoA ligase [Nocardioides piscis]